MKTIKKILISTLLVLFTFTGSIFAEKLIPSYKRFYIQSAKEYGKSWKGVWDVSGHPRKFKNGQKIQVWVMHTRDKRDKDRQFYFRHLHGDWYTIKSALRGSHALDVSGGNFRNGTPVQLYSRNNSISQKFKMKYLGRGRWKIFTKRNFVLSLGRKGSRNGSKVQLSRSSYSSSAQWMLIQPGAKRAFSPRVSSSSSNKPNVSKGATVPLKKVLMGRSTYQIEKYFKTCTSGQINQEKESFMKYLNGLNDTKRFTKLISVMKGAMKNPSRSATAVTYFTISQLNLKSSGFLAGMAKGLFKSEVNKALRKAPSVQTRMLKRILTKLR